MKNKTIIFCFTLIILAMSISGYILIDYSYNKGLKQGVIDNQANMLGITKTQYLGRSSVNHDNIMILVNEIRLSKGLSQLNTNSKMDGYAQERADKIKLTTKCDHSGFTDLLDKTGYIGVSEIISCGNNTSIDIMTKFSLSPTHNDILLRPDNKDMGIGISGAYVVIWFWRY